MTKRQDVHRPSAINPEEYQFVAFEHMRCEGMGDVQAILANRQLIQEHMARTGGTYSRHQHGGNCHICGASAIYTVLFYHAPTNSYIRTGEECADKLDFSDNGAMNAFRKAVHAAEEAKAGKAKARAILEREGLAAAWELYLLSLDGWDARQGETSRIVANARTIVFDIVGKLVQYGSLSEKQFAFMRKLLADIQNAPAIEAARKAANDAAAPVPLTDERIVVRGEVISIKVQDWAESQFAVSTRILVKTEQGYKLFGSLPKALSDIQKGARVEFSAQIKRSKDDAKFGFFSRPTKAQVLTA